MQLEICLLNYQRSETVRRKAKLVLRSTLELLHVQCTLRTNYTHCNVPRDCATTAAVTGKVWEEYFSVVCQISFRLAMTNRLLLSESERQTLCTITEIT